MRRLSTVLLSLLATAVIAGCGSTPEEGGGTPPAPTTGDGASPTAGAPTTGGTPDAGATTGGGTGGGGTGTPGGGGAATPAVRGSVTLVRSGGIAGVRQSISIKADGTWTYNDKRGTKTESGRIPTDQLTKIFKLATDPKLIAEIRAQPKPGVCNDAFNYSLQVGESMLAFEDCGQERPLTKEFLRTISAATPM